MQTLSNALLLALREIRRNLLRSSLTTLGIVIGVAAVIVMVTLGSGATAQVTSDIASLGSNVLTIVPGQRMGPGGASGGARALTPRTSMRSFATCPRSPPSRPRRRSR